MNNIKSDKIFLTKLLDSASDLFFEIGTREGKLEAISQKLLTGGIRFDTYDHKHKYFESIQKRINILKELEELFYTLSETKIMIKKLKENKGGIK